jgi:hypothetical protein
MTDQTFAHISIDLDALNILNGKQKFMFFSKFLEQNHFAAFYVWSIKLRHKMEAGNEFY